ncbi:MAG: TIGR04283 family arsenosugar biosynthesis glycosyltransferase [Anaerolineae bacterium]|nr:TIGR04283 family arsenosugar biosynthesis glycosyltransferase [Anaerolineae bacterium]
MLVSVIIPALNEAENIARTICAARRQYSLDELEIVVVDGGSTDGTPELVPPAPEVRLIRAPRGRAVQMNHGARASSGEILVFCHADSQLPAGWREAVITALDHPKASGGFFQTLILPEKGILRLINRVKFPADWRIMFGDLAQFMPRRIYDQVGGFPEIPLMEDVEMARLLHSAGKIVRVPLRVITSSRRFLENGPLRQWLLSLRCMVRYLYLGATAEEIARVYRSSRERQLE